MSSQHLNESTLLGIVSAMITPAILILAAGSLVNSTLTRMNRITDRARALLERIIELREAGDDVSAETNTRWLRNYQRRSSLTERALGSYYLAIFLFIAASLAIAIDTFTRDKIPWVALSLVLTGATALFTGTAALVIEANVAAGTLRDEIETLTNEHFPASRALAGDLIRRLARYAFPHSSDAT
jgi:hypothetical protein